MGFWALGPSEFRLHFRIRTHFLHSLLQGIDLVANGENEEVNISNLDDYLSLTLEFALETGIRKQMEAFRSGFNQVFPMEKLCTFTPTEVRTMLCGEQCPVFTRLAPTLTPQQLQCSLNFRVGIDHCCSLFSFWLVLKALQCATAVIESKHLHPLYQQTQMQFAKNGK